jgi:glycosyltransferase involved in cell wall biosynthesis
MAPVLLLPTPVDTSIWTTGSRSETPLIVWSGSSSGLPYLEEISAALSGILDRVPQARLRVVCNVAPTLPALAADRVEFMPWNPESEVASLQDAWLGLMPMPDTPWTRGKCSLKILTYLSCGVPALASPWGMNREIIDTGAGAFEATSTEEWIERATALLSNRDLVESAGRSGRALVESRYSVDVLAPRLLEAIHDVYARVEQN